jgi:DNA-binding transcriptional LysR family regulator
MRVYARVVDAGSFSEAARRLGISKALTSKYVGQLEQRLGVNLLNRTTRRLTPTELGTAYYARCARIVGEIEELEGSLHADRMGPRGHLRIAGPRIFGEDALVGCVQAFLEQHPAVTVDLVLEERAVDIVAEGFDLAVRIGELADTHLTARRITSTRDVAKSFCLPNR